MSALMNDNVTAMLTLLTTYKMYSVTILIIFSKPCSLGIVLCDQEILTLFRNLDTVKAEAIKVPEILKYLV
jgi:hypothetical protein